MGGRELVWEEMGVVAPKHIKWKFHLLLTRVALGNTINCNCKGAVTPTSFGPDLQSLDWTKIAGMKIGPGPKFSLHIGSYSEWKESFLQTRQQTKPRKIIRSSSWCSERRDGTGEQRHLQVKHLHQDVCDETGTSCSCRVLMQLLRYKTLKSDALQPKSGRRWAVCVCVLQTGLRLSENRKWKFLRPLINVSLQQLRRKDNEHLFEK